jgi:cytochrome P450
VLGDTTNFSNSGKAVLVQATATVGAATVGAATVARLPPRWPSLIGYDPPDHTRMRRLVPPGSP